MKMFIIENPLVTVQDIQEFEANLGLLCTKIIRQSTYRNL